MRIGYQQENVEQLMANRRIKRIDWSDSAKEFARKLDVTTEEVEQIVRNPGSTRWDKSSLDKGHLVVHHVSIDLVVVTGYLETSKPRVLGVYEVYETVNIRAPGRGRGSSLPGSWQELRRRIEDLGYLIVSGSNHPKVIDRNTGHLVYVLPGTPSSYSSLANCYKGFLRAHEEHIKGNQLTRRSA